MSRGYVYENELTDRIEEHDSAEEELQMAVTAAATHVSFVELNDPEDTEALAEAQQDLADAEGELNAWQQGGDCAERDALNTVLEEVTSDGFPLIPEGDFTDYARELCEEIGDIPKNFPSYIVIDWDATADNLKADYSTITLDGGEYYYRST